MKHLDKIVSAFLIVFSIGICIGSLRLGIGTLHSPGPGLLPLLSALILLLLTILVFIRDFHGISDEEENSSLNWEKNVSRQAIVVFALIGYAFLLGILGFLITSFLLISLLLFVFDTERGKIWAYLAIGAFVSTICFLVFYKWLQVQLPLSIFNIGF